MKVRRGDVVLVLYPFASGQGASRRPALIGLCVRPTKGLGALEHLRLRRGVQGLAGLCPPLTPPLRHA